MACGGRDGCPALAAYPIIRGANYPLVCYTSITQKYAQVKLLHRLGRTDSTLREKPLMM
ncbi:hypothetical protein BQ8482_160079 [Mesorhizobium delmotii]|uniref:Uncharacterized protein n=1 Tax=Mesorhizobium delmotii TaxID=1631247 RepID=A0A2P9AHI8_9HYPH|nr:hypothetical protein BQ8482_160079 [Mesorhizobium delmotii]